MEVFSKSVRSRRKRCLRKLWIEYVLGQFSSKKRQARKRYIEFVNDGMQARAPWPQLQGQIFVGSSQFVARMREFLGEKKEVGEIPKEQRYPGRPPLPDLLGTINDKQDRNKKIAIAHLEHGYILIEIAVALGIHYTTVSKVVKRVA